HGQNWQISYKGGYNPRLQFLNLTNSDVNDILFQSATSHKDSTYQYKLHSLNNKNLKNIKVPKQDYIKSTFKDNFKIEVTISPDQDPILTDIKNNANEYIDYGLYDESGTLLKSMSAQINDISLFEPVFHNE